MSNQSTKSEARTIIAAAVLIFAVGIALIAGTVFAFVTALETEKGEHIAAVLGLSVLATIWWVKIADILTSGDER